MSALFIRGSNSLWTGQEQPPKNSGICKRKWNRTKDHFKSLADKSNVLGGKGEEKSSKRYNQQSINSMQLSMRIMRSDSKCSLAVGFLFSWSSNQLTQSTYKKDFWVSVIQECKRKGSVRVYFCTKWLHENSHPKSSQWPHRKFRNKLCKTGHPEGCFPFTPFQLQWVAGEGFLKQRLHLGSYGALIPP